MSFGKVVGETDLPEHHVRFAAANIQRDAAVRIVYDVTFPEVRRLGAVVIPGAEVQGAKRFPKGNQ